MVYSPTWMVDFHGTLVGKNTSPMEHLGYENIVHWRIISFRKCLATMVSESFNWGCSPFQMALFMAYTWLRLLVPTPPHPHPENQQKTPRPSKGRGPTTLLVAVAKPPSKSVHLAKSVGYKHDLGPELKVVVEPVLSEARLFEVMVGAHVPKQSRFGHLFAEVPHMQSSVLSLPHGLA